MAQRLLEPDGDLYIGQRITTEADEGAVLGGVRPLENFGEEGDEVGRSGRRVGRFGHRAGPVGFPGQPVGLLGKPARRRVVRLPVRQPWQLADDVHAHRLDGQVARPGGDPPDIHGVRAAGRHHGEPVVVTEAAGVHAVLCERVVDPLQVDAQAEELGEPAAPPDDLEQPVRGAAGEVAGAQLVTVRPRPDPPRTRRSPASRWARCRPARRCRVRPAGDGVEPQRAAGDRDADALRVLRRQARAAGTPSARSPRSGRTSRMKSQPLRRPSSA